ncbi:hypothetical protein [Streptococcus pacificus]|uniref:Uncharacterized protein n=1 Tax=Streptococcus pacificus TaxID=2740577 RepID=A0ABS0ZI00_9STRE|nr:hypothetical protein [Streptococcus pacificus]MBJ8325605.1 hypothetical protein [Streptococcus pacificus]
MIQGQFTNGELSGVKLSTLDVVTSSLGIEDGNLKANLSLSLFGNTVEVNAGIGKDGLDISAGADNGKNGYDVGLNLNADFEHGLLGAYTNSRTIITDPNGVITTNTTESGFRVLNDKIIAVGLLAGSVFVLFASIGTGAVPASITASAALAIILGTEDE